MRKGLLEILKCPVCNKNSFGLEISGDETLEIKTGRINCENCKAEYRIENGIVDFLKNASGSAMRERKAMDEDEYITDEQGNKYRITNEVIERFKAEFLSMPEGDGSHFFKRGGSFQSIARLSPRFYSTLNSLNLTGKETVLEIGACFSYASFKFAEKGCRVIATDVSNYLKVSRLFTEKAYFDRIFCDMHRTPFRDNVFDIVFGSAVFHHTKELAVAFSEMHRVLKSGGRLVLINESARGIFEKVHPVFERKKRQGYGDTSYNLLEWTKAAHAGGFKKIKIEFLSLADDYITRHKNRDPKDSFKLRLAHFLNRQERVERYLLSLLVLPRFLFRPKSWRIVCFK